LIFKSIVPNDSGSELGSTAAKMKDLSFSFSIRVTVYLATKNALKRKERKRKEASNGSGIVMN
jgi:hypothetical protein